MNRLLYIFVLLISFGCKKPEESDDWTEVHVKATNYNTGEPLSDIYIGIIERRNKLLSDSQAESISEGFTDMNGEYHFGWKAKKNNNYSYEYVAQADPGEYYQVNFQQINYPSKGAISNYTIEMLPYGQLYFNYENQNCFDDTDTMWFKWDHELIEFQSEDWNPLPRTGCYSLFVDNPYNFPCGHYVFTMKIKRNDVTTYIDKEITIYESVADTIELFY